MRILFDARMAQWTGVGRYITGLVPTLFRMDPKDEYIVLLNPGDATDFCPDLPNVRKVFCRRALKPYSLSEQMFLHRELGRHGADLVHIPHFNVPRLVPPPFIVTIHDLIYLLFPEDAPSRLAFWAAKRMIRSAVRRAEMILSVSENTRADLVRLLDVDADRIRVSWLGPPNFRAVSPGTASLEGLDGPYLLYTGNHSPHKNLKTLLEALDLLRRDGLDLKLVITGKRDRHTPSVETRVAALGLGKHVIFTGKVPDEKLVALYAGAAVLVFPSLYEGFGIPPLEAFASGVPVVASRAASIPEVLGDAALLVDPRDPAAFRDAISKVTRDEAMRIDLVDRGRKRLEAFSWEKTAAATLDVYRKTAECLPVPGS